MEGRRRILSVSGWFSAAGRKNRKQNGSVVPDRNEGPQILKRVVPSVKSIFRSPTLPLSKNGVTCKMLTSSVLVPRGIMVIVRDHMFDSFERDSMTWPFSIPDLSL